MAHATLGRNCRNCGNDQWLERKHKSGRQGGPYYDCYACAKKRLTEWKHRNAEHVKSENHTYYTANAGRVKKQARAWIDSNHSRWLCYKAKERAKKLNLPFDLTPDDVTIPNTCPVLGIPLFRNCGSVGPNSPTLDRIQPESGYVKGNVLVVSHKANTMKSDASIEEVRRLLSWMESRCLYTA